MNSYIETWMNNVTTMIVIPLLGSVLLFALAFGPKIALRIETARYNSGIKNILLMLLNGYMIGVIVTGAGLLSKFVFAHGLPHIPADMWVNVPAPLVFVFILIALDFTNYWNHRVLHTRLIWGIHAIHHSDADINWTTSYRIHVLEWVIMTGGFLLLMGWMSLPAWGLASAAFVHGAYNKYVHCQVGWTHGVLARWLISPNYHRWHHADDPAAYNKNFGDMLAIWDRMFGTYYDGGVCDAKLGLPNGPTSLPAMMLYPFKYWRDEYFSKSGPDAPKSHALKS